jgi:myo-inositol 2-dehydrogenase/D-chiro-inositol 1-dehydrogenase
MNHPSLRLGVIGCGSMARTHLDMLRNVPEISVQAYSDVRLEAAEYCLKTYGGRYATANPEQLLSDPTLDAILICTWHDSHAPLAIAAAQAGKHIFLEKPMALTLAECRAIEEAVVAAGVQMMLGFKFRFAPYVQKLKGRFPLPILTVGQIIDERWPEEFWAQHPMHGGGNVLSQGVHAFDLVRYLHGRRPVRVVAGGGALTHPGSTLVDTVAATILFDDGSIASVIVADAGRAAFTSKFFFELFAISQSATLHNRCRALTMVEDGVVHRFGEEDLSPDDRMSPEGVLQQWREFARCVQTGNASVIGAGPADGRWATALALAACEAARTGRPQELPS